jgi:hypothetical protein
VLHAGLQADFAFHWKLLSRLETAVIGLTRLYSERFIK